MKTLSSHRDLYHSLLHQYLTDGELGIVGFSHGVVDEGGHQFSDLVQVAGPGFLRGEGTQKRQKRCRIK